MAFSEKALFGHKSNFSSDLTETDVDLVYFVVKIVCVKMINIRPEAIDGINHIQLRKTNIIHKSIPFGMYILSPLLGKI